MASDQSGGVVGWLAAYPNLKSMRIGGFGLLFVLFGGMYLWVSGGLNVLYLAILGFSAVMCLWTAWADYYTN
ncbi:hypothetical protein [Halonotius roseus]|jgi:hypothetical protein|uniref:Uncharacterized protein n=1 Tax=Halonotius roseus TaxID=2511997 RepID=A0A544QQ37_9EURY|nr:hypothetical protein [Halonotius roseus]TQQ81558.1 hypothetical protein EWF95_01030 [Halonotius roseus]